LCGYLYNGAVMKSRSSQSNLQEKIVDVAADLFYERGIHAVGVDEIVAQAGIAKMTLYKYFLSKDQLVMAVLKRNEERWWSWFEPEVKRRGKTPSRRLLAIFDALGEWFEKDSFRGSPFINARIQVADSMYPIHLVTEEFKQRLRDYMVDLAQMADIANPAQLADQLLLLIVGANVSAAMETAARKKTAIRLAKKTAAMLIEESSRC
jgi:AcrR family transcriptional regulator